jgi:hypothetical protein
MTDAVWRNRIVGHGVKPADQFTHHPSNPKFHPPEQRAALRGAIAEIGVIAPVIENVRTGYLIDGHERVWLALETNEDVPYIQVDLDADEEAYALATLDPIGMMARHDAEKLDALLREVNSAEAGVQALLASLGRIDVIGMETIGKRENNNFNSLGGDLGEWVGFNFGHIMVSLPRAIHDRMETYVDDPRHSTRKEAVIALLEAGIKSLC